MSSVDMTMLLPISEYRSERTTVVAKTGVSSTLIRNVKSPQTAVYQSLKRSSRVTPNYRSIVENGGVLPDNPLTLERVSEGHLLGGKAIYSSHALNGDYTVEVRDVSLANVYVPGSLSNPFTMSMHAPRLLNQAMGAQWSIPVFYGEAGRTAEMIATSATRIYRMFRYLKSGNFKAFYYSWSKKNPAARNWGRRKLSRATRKFARNFGTNPRQAISSAWLEYQYGWMPLLLDSYNAMETLSDLRNKPQSYIGRVTSQLKERRISVIDSPDRIGKIADVLTGGRIHLSHELSSKAVWRFSTRETGNIIGKLGFTNPLSVGWELVPLSFVADWFLPIGQYLASLDAPMRLNHIGGTLGFKQVSSGVTTLTTAASGWKLYPRMFKTATYLKVTVSPITSIPSMKLSEMNFTPGIGGRRATSAIALLQNVFKGF